MEKDLLDRISQLSGVIEATRGHPNLNRIHELAMADLQKINEDLSGKKNLRADTPRAQPDSPGEVTGDPINRRM